MALTKLGKESYEATKQLHAESEREQLMVLYAEAKTAAEQLEGELEFLKEAILGSMLERGEDSFKIDGVGSAAVQPGRRISTVSPQKLLELGVDSDVIEQATEVKEGDPFVVIRISR